MAAFEEEQRYTGRELEVLRTALALFDDFRERASKKLPTTTPLAQAEMAFTEGDPHAWGWATSIVRASPQQALAFL